MVYFMDNIACTWFISMGN